MANINIPDEGNGPEKGDLKQYVRSDAVQKNENARHDDMGVLLSDDIRRWVRSHAHTFNFADTRRQTHYYGYRHRFTNEAAPRLPTGPLSR